MKPARLHSLPVVTGSVGFATVRRRPRLGQILVASGLLSHGDRRTALHLQSRADARFGDILLARSLIDPPRLLDALSLQFKAPLADFLDRPPSAERTATLGAQTCLRLGILPLSRDQDGKVWVATSRPEEFEHHLPWLTRHLGPVRMALAEDRTLKRALADLMPADLALHAETRLAEADSCRTLAMNLARVHPFALVLVLLLAICVAFFPVHAMRIFTVWAIVTLLANTALKCAALVTTARAMRQTPVTDASRPILARLPRVSLLVPLFEERAIAGQLITRLSRIDYPPELLDICLIVEADDVITRDTLGGFDLPPNMQVIIVPDGRIKTKPRALNYALDFCRGTLIGVYDAEDAPDPDQVSRVVQRFHERGPELACVQSVLDFYNSRSNWLARCFAVEYAAWFRVVLPGMTRMGLVAPLGGTSLFFRRSVLEELGGWDAHNVTEDADLGVRLARYGYRCEFIDSVTAEEANCRAWPWVRQRSRWLKGYMLTWAVHMRCPWRLLTALGPWRFLGIQILFLGTISQFLLAPFLWLFWVMPFGLAHPFAPAMSTAAMIALIATFLLSEIISLAVSLYAVRGPRHRHLAPWVITLHFYFPLAALAAYKGLFELLTRPFFWDKTAHGIYDATDGPSDPPAPKAEAAEPVFSRRRRRRA